MKYCHFIITISLIAFILLTGCIEPTAHVDWAPPILKPVLLYTSDFDEDRLLTDDEPVEVEIGKSVSISIANFFEANYQTIEWYIGYEITENTAYAFIVKTDRNSDFHEEGTYKLTVIGTHKGGSKTTSINIVVKIPDVAPPILLNKTTTPTPGGDYPEVGYGETVDVVLGNTVTFEVENYWDYSSFEWYNIDGHNLWTSLSYTLYTTNTSPFNTVGEHALTFRGTGINSKGEKNFTTIKINVTPPEDCPPKLLNMNTGELVNANGTVTVKRGDSVTISVDNVSDYKSFKWVCVGAQDVTAPVYFVSTFEPPFNITNTKTLTVTGTTSLDLPYSTTITINVTDPDEKKPQLQVTINGIEQNPNVIINVERGKSATVSVTNVPDFISYEWTSGTNDLHNTAPVYFVSTTDPSSLFYAVGQKELTVTGKTITGDKYFTKININVTPQVFDAPQLKNMNTGNILAAENAEVEVYMGSFVTISINNAPTYFSFEWKGTKLPGTATDLNNNSTFYNVSATDPSSFFYTAGTYKLDVKGTTILGDSKTTTITIKVTRPDIDEPTLRNMNTNKILNDNDSDDDMAKVDLGSSLTILIDNYGQNLYQDIKWYIKIGGNYVQQSQGTATFTVNAASSPIFNTAKVKHDLRVTMEKYGVTYERNIKIGVRNPPEQVWKEYEGVQNIIEWIMDPNLDNSFSSEWETNEVITRGNAAWYIIHSNFAGTPPQTFIDDRILIFEFMEDTTVDGRSWTLSPSTMAGLGYQIYIRLQGDGDGNPTEAHIRISNDAGTIRQTHVYKLGVYAIEYVDDVYP